MHTTSQDVTISAGNRVRKEPYPAEKARQGEIILKTKLSRIVFLTGLFGGLVVLAILAISLGILS